MSVAPPALMEFRQQYLATAVLSIIHRRLLAVVKHLTDDRRVLFHLPRVFLELHHRESMIALAGARGHATREGGGRAEDRYCSLSSATGLGWQAECVAR